MSMTHTIDRGDRIALLEGRGELDFAGWAMEVTEMLGDPAFTANHRVLFDRTGVTALESKAFVDEVLAFFNQHQWRLRDTLWAVVVGDTQESCGLARSLAIRADRAGVEMRVFTNHLNAVVWLDAKAEARVPVRVLRGGESPR